MNSSDPDVLRKVLLDILDEDCVVDSFKLQAVNNIGSEELESCVSGRSEVIEYFIGYVNSIPDMIFLCHEWRIFNRPNNQSCLVFKFSLTGSQIFQHEMKCNVEDINDHLPANYENLDVWGEAIEASACNNAGKGKQDSEHSIKFRDMVHHRGDLKRRKVTSTIGQYVDLNKVETHHMPELKELKDDIATEEKIELMPLRSQKIKGANDPTVSMCISPRNLQLLQDASKINIRGVMRFTMNDLHRITKIHCVHIHGVQ